MTSSRHFPVRGKAWPEIEQALFRFRGEDHPWRYFGFDWPHRNPDVRLVGKSAGNIFFDTFVFGRQLTNKSAFPVWGDIKKIVPEILGAGEGAHCTVTSGGTESNFMAVKTARDKAAAVRPVDGVPEIIIPYTAHPSFDKAAHYLGLKTIRVPERADYRADVAATEAAITDRTILIVGSAPAFPHGRIDPIGELAALAAARGIWCHVDACVGGFLLPFLKRLGHDIPDFAFAVPGVTSVSADLHKFGQTPLGISTFTLRDEDDLQYQIFEFRDWPAGRLRVEGFGGSGSGRAMAAAWAVLQYLGEEGYIEQARLIARAGEMLADAVEQIDGLELLVRPEAGILLFRPTDTDVRAVAAALNHRSFGAFVCEEPLAIHMFIDPVPDEAPILDFIAAIKESLADARAGRVTGEGSSQGYT